MDSRRVLGRGEGRISVRPRRRRHEGRHRLQRRGCAGLSRRKRRPAERLDLVSDHRRRGRHRRQRHDKTVAMGGGARREIRSLRIGRTQQRRRTRRLHQGRPPRFAVGDAHRRRHPGPRRLSASRVESGAGHRGADRGAEQRAARSRQRAFPGVQSRIHLGRCRQYREQCDPGVRRARNSTSASTIITARSRCGR